MLICIFASFLTQRVLKLWWLWIYQNFAVKRISARIVSGWVNSRKVWFKRVKNKQYYVITSDPYISPLELNCINLNKCMDIVPTMVEAIIGEWLSLESRHSFNSSNIFPWSHTHKSKLQITNQTGLVQGNRVYMTKKHIYQFDMTNDYPFGPFNLDQVYVKGLINLVYSSVILLLVLLN
jgi:hypothetical protein